MLPVQKTGHPLPGQGPGVSRRATTSPTAFSLKVAWIVGVAWGCLNVLASTLPPIPGAEDVSSFFRALGLGVAGLLIICLALAVKRGDRAAAWGLVSLQMIVVLKNLTSFRGWGLALLVLILVVFVRGAIYAQRHRVTLPDAEVWIRLVYQLAFLQGSYTGLEVLWSRAFAGVGALPLFFGRRVTELYLLDVAILYGLGFAVWRRRVWAAYMLVLYQATNAVFYNVQGASSYIPYGFVLVYVTGAFYMRRLLGPLGRGARVAVGIVAVIAVASSAYFILQRRTPYQLFSWNLELRLLAVPGLEGWLKAAPAPDALKLELVRKGVSRLEDVELLTGLDLVDRFLDAAPTDTCAGMARGEEVPKPILERIEAGSLGTWFNLAFKAIAFEYYAKTPGHAPPTRAETEASFRALEARLPEADRKRLAKIRSEGERANDADVCWAYHKAIGVARSAEGPLLRTIARSMIASAMGPATVQMPGPVPVFGSAPSPTPIPENDRH